MRKLLLALIAAAALLAIQAQGALALPHIKHVFILMLENESEGTSFGPASKAPYLAHTLTRQGEFLPNYYGIGHNSLDNYIALISGQAPNATTQADCQFYMDVIPGTIGANGQASGVGCVYPSAVQTVANQLDADGLPWKGYMEDMGNAPGEAKTCSHPALNSQDHTQAARVGDEYATRHDPFVYFHSIIDSPTCTQNVVPLTLLPSALKKARTTPAYSFITPNLCDDGHDSPCVDGRPGGLVSADAFLRRWVPRITGSAAYKQGGLLIITFDEASTSDSTACCGEQPGPGSPTPGGQNPGAGGGKVGAVLLSPYVQPATVDQTAYNHYALLRSVEDIFGLGHLGFAAQAGLKAFGSDVFNRQSVPNGPRIKLSGIPSACTSGAFTVRVNVKSNGRLRSVLVKLDGARLKRSHRRKLRVRVHSLTTGGHQLQFRAVDHAGRKTTVTLPVSGC
jgi:phosphatidylinositol-3-phosphatase